MTRFPDSVAEAALRHELVFVIGSGVSSASNDSQGKRPPGWSKLLRNLAERIDLGRDYPLGLEAFDVLLKSGSLLEAAELLYYHAEEKNRLPDFRRALRDQVDGRGNDNFSPNTWHNVIFAFDPKIIITTNFDRIIERATDSTYDVQLFNSPNTGEAVRSGSPTLIKIHGSVDNLSDLILTQGQYSKLHVKGSHSLAVIEALFLTRTVVFVGYSISDPDIRLLLQNTVGGRNDMPAHYMLTPSLKDYQREMLRSAFGVAAIEFPYLEPASDGPDFSAGLKILMDLEERVRARKAEESSFL